MIRAIPDQNDPEIESALQELKGLILARFPEATFQVIDGDDPLGVHLRAVVDVDDIEEVLDVVMDRLLTMQLDEGLPVYILPSWPPERIAEELARRKRGLPLPTFP